MVFEVGVLKQPLVHAAFGCHVVVEGFKFVNNTLHVRHLLRKLDVEELVTHAQLKLHLSIVLFERLEQRQAIELEVQLWRH